MADKAKEISKNRKRNERNNPGSCFCKAKKEGQLYNVTYATVGVTLCALGSCLRSYELWTVIRRVIAPCVCYGQ